ncbi:hypothetical protein WUBG_02124 [Wuchereria bancrofti]|uniref:Uncharacterized protein n=1 Tax=Wuchereria bancrofti TaxID=6293 RepID=J9EWG7_WUCBA|nr:hypothetical protein WUBG_02124 [Wuchereria bancrofti]VDM22261.1 unnamed protein product [Wuchereria bancrofti]
MERFWIKDIHEVDGNNQIDLIAFQDRNVIEHMKQNKTTVRLSSVIECSSVAKAQSKNFEKCEGTQLILRAKGYKTEKLQLKSTFMRFVSTEKLRKQSSSSYYKYNKNHHDMHSGSNQLEEERRDKLNNGDFRLESEKKWIMG